MASKLFISYSHLDERVLDRLHKHLAMLKREGLVDVWYDREINAGDVVDAEIGNELAASDIFVALVSPDFLASNYCYEKEMRSALARNAQGAMRIVPIIVEPCDWKSSPLSAFKALPKDGKPVSQWSNENVALLDVVTELRAVLTRDPDVSSGDNLQNRVSRQPSRQIKVKRDFDAIDRADFRDQSFETIRTFFERSVLELDQIDGLRARYESMSRTAFTCTVVNRSKRDSEAHITVHNQKNRHLGDITYSQSDHAEPTSANGMVNVDSDEFQLFLRLDSFIRNSERKLTAEQVAQIMWDDFMQRAGIEYE